MGGIPAKSPIQQSRDSNPIATLDTVTRSVVFADGMEVPCEHVARFQRMEQETK